MVENGNRRIYNVDYNIGAVINNKNRIIFFTNKQIFKFKNKKIIIFYLGFMWKST